MLCIFQRNLGLGTRKLQKRLGPYYILCMGFSIEPIFLLAKNCIWESLLLSQGHGFKLRRKGRQNVVLVNKLVLEALG
ncbi:hypothetical protein VNO78_23705 [Psophocarpus tetragonolobus]|uniref:Uncharacterized protein n=1 Tax=Psophocarpus tetragonolobus TaxID=3891 RepID=A0AAN9S779_PSOTE